MKRGFSLVELVMASFIAGIVMTSLCMALTGVWREALKTNEEMQSVVQASAMRDWVLLGTAKTGAPGFHGLLNVTNEVKAIANGAVLQVDPGGPNEARQSLPQTALPQIAVGKTKRNSEGSVTVADASPDEDEQLYNDVEKRQRILMYLWCETKAGTVCRMPVCVTTVRYEPATAEGGGK